MSLADDIFIDNCKNILQHGFINETENTRAHWADGTPAHTKKLFGIINRYDLSKEFPVSTLRPFYLKTCVNELLWMYQKKSNKVSELKSHIWDNWVLPDGTIGKTYGYQMGVKHKYSDGEFDQIDRILKDLKENPYSRRMVTSMFNHHDLHEMALHPCVWSMTFNVVGNKLNMILNQRSQDMLTANCWDVCQHALLLHMFAHVSNLEVGELVHVIADCHIYDRHIPLVEELITRKAFNAPILKINHHDSFYDYTEDDFKLENYEHGTQVKFEVAI